MDIKERFYQNLQESREQLDELRGKGTLDKKDKEKLQGRIRDKHGKAWTETERIRKEKKSKGSEDTKSIDKFRNRLAKIHNKLDEEQMNEAGDSYKRYLSRMTRDTSKRKSEWSKKIGRQQRQAEKELTPAARAARDAAAERKIDEEQLNELKGYGNKKLLRKVQKRATDRLVKSTDPMWTSKSGMKDKDKKTASKNQKVAGWAYDRMKD